MKPPYFLSIKTTLVKRSHSSAIAHTGCNVGVINAPSKSVFLTLALVILILCGPLGCQSTASYDDAKRAQSPTVDIFRDGEKPQRKYREIGMVADDGRKSEQPGIETKMIRKAKTAGANAILFMPLEESGEELRPGMLGLATTYTFKALFVVYE